MMGGAPGYSHTQKGIIFPILAGCSAVFLAIGIFYDQYPPMIFAAILFPISFAFMHLDVKDRGDRLAVRFGPVSIFRKSIPYSQITGVEADRSRFFDGWGIHWTRKGWLWNIGGYDCVRIYLGKRSTLVGTDDPEGLISFLHSVIEGNQERKEV